MHFKPLHIRLFICALMVPIIGLAQQSKIDSLYKALNTKKADTDKINTIVELSIQYENAGKYRVADSLARQAMVLANKLGYMRGAAIACGQLGSIYADEGNSSEALDYTSKALTIREQLKDKKGMAATLNRMGLVYQQESEYSLALDCFSKDLAICEEIGDKEGKASAHNNIGLVYLSQGKYPKALDEMLTALKTLEQLGDKQGAASIHEAIGNLYNEQRDSTKALEEYNKALNTYREMQNENEIANSLCNIGLVYSEQKDKDSLSLKYFRQSLDIRNKIGDNNGIAISLLNMGGIYFQEGKIDITLTCFIRSLTLFEGTGNKDGISNSLNAIGQVYISQKKYNKALEYENKSLALSKEMGSVEGIESAYQQLSDLYDSLHNDRKAFEFYKNYIVEHDSLFNKENTKKTVESEMNFQFEKKQAVEKAEQEQKEEIQKEQERKQTLILYFISGILLLVCGFAVFIFRSLRITSKQKKVIEIKSRETEEQKKVVEERNKIIEEKNKDILDSINYAKRLQDAILPPLSIIKKYLPESFVLYKPKDIVAGDFYWMERAGDTILIAAADCTGHGVPGAMVSVVCSNALNRTVKEFKITEPGKILDKVRELVLETFEKSEDNVQDGMDISLASLSPSNGGIEVKWAGAFNSLWYVHDGQMHEIAADKQPIGKTDNPKAFTTHAVTFPQIVPSGNGGALLYLFTDGYADQFGGPKGKKFKYKQLSEKLLAISQQPLDEQKLQLETTIEEWKGNLEQVDDILVIGIRA
jgi:tetratricopeptide (TPR) repeat protein